MRGRDDAKEWILAMLSRCGICSTEQAGEVYSYRKDPTLRARNLLRDLREAGYIESRPRARGSHVHRLTTEVRRAARIRPIRWDSLLDHKLAITDLYLALSAPAQFRREYRHAFRAGGRVAQIFPDAFSFLEGRPTYWEVQRTRIETNRWSVKRRLYEIYFASDAWMDRFDKRPQVIVWQADDQQPSTIGRGNGYELIVTRDLREVIVDGLDWRSQPHG